MPDLPIVQHLVPTAQRIGICPHCGIGVRFEVPTIKIGAGNLQTSSFAIQTPSGYQADAVACGCPACGKPIVSLTHVRSSGGSEVVQSILYPDAINRPVPNEVESEAPALASDFREAVLVYPKSKQASAALSRRCLQIILTTKGGATKRDLAEQIEEVIPKLPHELAENVDAIRHVGNFAAHPQKSKSTGEIVKVEEGEAEWLLDVLEELFEHYYVAPARTAAKRAALNQKLADLGKPPMKASKPSRK